MRSPQIRTVSIYRTARKGQIGLWMLTNSFLGAPTVPPRTWDAPPSLTTRKGQIGLWMLTKFSMIFFIVLLAVLMGGFSETEKRGVCGTQANAVAVALASTINNVINSPAEDERKVIPLQPALSSGKRDFERYWIELTNIPSDKPKTGSITVHVRTNTACQGIARASYDSSITLDRTLAPRKAFYLFPSNITVRDYYLVMIKCHPKQPGWNDFLFVRACSAPLGVQADPRSQECLQLNDTIVENCCGWNVVAGGGRPKCQ